MFIVTGLGEIKLSDERWVIPSLWQWVKLEEIVLRLGDGLHGTPKYDNKGEYFFINGNNLSNGVIEIKETTKRVSFDEYLKHKKNLDENTVFVSINGTIGNVAFYNNEKVILGKSACYFNLFSGIYKNYIKYLINSNYFIRYALKLATGTTIKNVSLKTMRSFLVPLPPLNEQKRIVTKIEALQTRSTTVKKELEAIKPLLNQFRQSVLAAAFRGDLTKDWRSQNPDVEPALKLIQSNSDIVSNYLPISWCQALVGDVVENLKYGTSKKCRYEIDGIPVLRIPNIVDGTINHSDLKYAQLPDKEFDKLRLISGDILMIRSNGSASLVGRTAIIREAEKDFAYAGYLIRLRPNKGLVYPEYLNLWFSSYEIRLQIEIPLRSTSGVNNINSDETKKLNIPIPPLQEQKEIVRRIESLFKLADNIEQQYQQASNNLETLNQSILAKAFRGELVPQDPNDEPASILLERIREEREKATAKKSKTKKTSSKKQEKQLGIPGI